jgi:glycosyltransferase involved in cell wall biosynthesis
MASKRPRVVVGIPAFDEESHIAQVIVAAKPFADEIIVCDDGSSDLTGEISRELGAVVVRHDKNIGYGAALESIFDKALMDGADILVTLDSDGQHDPRSIPRLLFPIESDEADIVIGSRYIQEGGSVPKYRTAGIKAISAVSGVLAYPNLTDAQSGFRAYSRSAAKAVAPAELGMGASVEILSKANEAHLRIVEVPIEVKYMQDSSTHNPVYHGMDVILSGVKHASIRHPLMLYGMPGLVLLAVAAGFWWWTISLYQLEHKVITNVALAAIAGTVVGLLLLAVGVILWVIITVIREGRSRAFS